MRIPVWHVLRAGSVPAASAGLAGVFCVSAVSAGAQMTFTSDVYNSGSGTNISSLLGATAFYNAGFTGAGAIVSNIEGGLFYKYEQPLATDTIQLNYGGTLPLSNDGSPSNPSSLNDPNLIGDPNWSLYDAHATSVAGVIAGAPQYSGDPNAGIAYGATLVGGAISTGWVGSPYSESFNATDQSFMTPYAEAMQTGIPQLGGALTNVVNGSYGYQDTGAGSTNTGTSGSDYLTVALDGLAKSSGATVVWAAGNNGYGNGNVNDPAAGFNGISVAALDYGSASDPYSSIVGFSSGGPGNYIAPDGTVIMGVRAVVDIAAPGVGINTLNYTGATGGNLGATPPATVPNDTYGGFSAGTSFAAPIVAGAATLLVNAGNVLYGGGNAVNGNVIKAVLMNSADKIAGWNNGQTTVNGVVTTSQALDYSSGAGALNMGAAYTQYTSGSANISNGSLMAGTATGLSTVGWDYGFLNPAMTGKYFNDYYFGTSLLGGTTFSATLTWFVDDTYNGLVDEAGTETATSSQLRFTNLYLELYQVEGGAPDQLIAISDAEYISSQEFYFTIPQTGDYLLQVYWAGDQYDLNNSDAEGQDYGLAWSGTSSGFSSEPLLGAASAPDASSILLVVLGVAVIGVTIVRRASEHRPSVA